MLYIIGTPIGNLGDISKRSVETLEQLDLLLCEDTRVTGKLLENLKIHNKPRLISYYDEVEQQKIPEVLNLLREGLEVGLISDAGTPLISDPGWVLLKKCQENGIKYTSIPGPSAVVNALVLSGLPPARFSFLGFLPKKDGDIKKLLNKYKEIEGTKIAYDSPFRVEKSVKLIKEIFGDKIEIKIVREMTKMYEEVMSEIIGEIKGEVVICWN